MTVLVLADHANGRLLESTARLVGAALQIGGDVRILVAGAGCAEIARDAAAIAGVSRVLLADDAALAHQTAEPLAELLVHLAADHAVLMASSGTTGKNVMPRVAARLDVMQISDVTAVRSADTFERPIYAGSAIATVQSTDPRIVMTVRANRFAPAAGGGAAPVETVAAVPCAVSARFVSLEATAGDRPDLGAARFVVSGGRAFGSKEKFEAFIVPLAGKLGAAIGASRAAVDAGYVTSDCQVGQTGRAVAPDLYIACGISGAIQHLAGMKESKTIVAINTDPEAPIFQVADYGLVGDVFAVLPELTAKL